MYINYREWKKVGLSKMKNLIISLFILVLIPAIFAGDTQNVCLDTNTLLTTINKTINLDGTLQQLQMTENIHCPYGCDNNECKPAKSNIPIELYLLLSVVAIGMMLFSFIKEDTIIFKWITVILLIMLGISSFNINRVYCEYTTAGFMCFVHEYNSTALVYFWFGLSVVMLIFAFISSIMTPGRAIMDEERRF